MAQSAVNKSKIIEKFKVHPSDTGSSEVQIALLTDRIQYLTDHFKIHKKDHHSSVLTGAFDGVYLCLHDCLE